MKKKLKAFFKKNPGRQFKSKEIARRLDLTEEHEYAAMKAALHELYKEQYLSKSGKRYKLYSIPATNKIQGIKHIIENNFSWNNVYSFVWIY